MRPGEEIEVFGEKFKIPEEVKVNEEEIMIRVNQQ